MPKITSVRPYFGKPPVVRSPFSLSVIRDLHFNSVHLKTVTQAEQKGKLFGRLASVLWVLCTCQCACLVALAIRDFAYSPPVMVQLLALCDLQMCLTWCIGFHFLFSKINFIVFVCFFRNIFCHQVKEIHCLL